MREVDDATIRSEATDLLRELIRLDSSNPPGNETPVAEHLRKYLEASGVQCELVAKDPRRANLIARIKGSNSGPSLAFLGHTDVVPAAPDDWKHPPFSGHLDGTGFVWGRGAVDMKNQTATRAVAVAMLARAGFVPKGELLFIAQADEEDGTEEVGLTWLREARPDIACDYSIDEGGGEKLVLADGRVIVPLNVGEKATLPVRVTALGEAGHASTPAAGVNSVPLLAALITRLSVHKTERRILPEARRMLEALVGPFDDVEAALARAGKLHPNFARELPSLFGTTIAPTRLVGSSARNVMPANASVECDCRVMPGTGADELETELRAALGNDIPFDLEFLEPPTGGTIAPLDTPLFRICQEFLDEHEPGAILTPSISSGFCDSHYMRESFGTVAYGFWPMRNTPTEVYFDGFHNRDERIHVEDLVYATRFHLFAAQRIGLA